MPSLVDITFNENPSGVYFSGQMLSGKVKLITERAKTIKGIHVIIQGRAKVEWVESEAGGKMITVYGSHEDYFKSRIYVMGSEIANSFNLEPGKYEFDFQVQLPSEIPTSFHGRHGKVKYEVICTIDRPLKFNNVFKQPFTAIYPVDFNLQPSYLQPVQREIKKSFSKFLFLGDRGEVYVKIDTPCGGYVPGQSIPVSILIKNLANVTTYETNVCLIQAVEYRATSPFKRSKYENRVVSLQYLGPLEKKKGKEVQCHLKIPAVAPSSFSSCKIIELSYTVEIQLKTRGLHRSMNVNLPVTIGTVPYGCLQKNKNQDMPSTSNHTPDLKDLPTYEQAVKLGQDFVDEDDEDKYAQTFDYTPIYPIYNNISIPAVFPGQLPASMETKEKP